MKADLTRNTFDPFRHFSRVLMQQGRVQLDADWNEQAAILLRYVRSLAADLIGEAGGPENNLGFAITTGSLSPAPPYDFRIGLGRYYVHGILCEADSLPLRVISSVLGPSSVQLVVDRLTLDGAPIVPNQLVELFDEVASSGTSPVVVQVTQVDATNLTLTCQPSWTGSKWTAPSLRRVISYKTQPDYPLASDRQLSSGTYLVYLDVWERHISYVEDGQIRELALGGPDTATRAQVIWQVKVVAGSGTTCDEFSFSDANFAGQILALGRGALKAKALQGTTAKDPCIVSPLARYRGPDNQLYRVEIHTPGRAWDGTRNAPEGAASFKWSRENGSVVFPIVSLTTGGGTTTLKLEHLGRDDRFGLAEGQWVEVVDDSYVLQNDSANLLQVQAIDRSSLTVTLNGVSSYAQSSALHPLLRRWDHVPGDPAEGGLQLGADGAALLLEGLWLELEDGVHVQFQPPRPPPAGKQTADAVQNQYRAGDYWLVPARTATGDVEWPRETEQDAQGNPVTVPIAKGPDGIEHHYAPLGVISVNASGAVSVVAECRKQFGSLAATKAVGP